MVKKERDQRQSSALRSVSPSLDGSSPPAPERQLWLNLVRIPDAKGQVRAPKPSV